MEYTQLKDRESEKGFTLVELAIVMIIIGLLITGVLKGQEMIANAKVTSSVAQTKGIEAAVSTFDDIYNALPGDMLNPDTRLANCDGTNCSTDGDGNGRVDEAALGAGTGVGEENLRFFSHLAAANLLNGVQVEAADATFGEGVLETQIGSSGYTVGYSADGDATSLTGPTDMRSGHYLAIVPDAEEDAPGAAGDAAITPTQAGRLDRKIDDGNPNTGGVRAGGDDCADATDETGVYVESSGSNDCNLFLRIQG